MLFLSADGLTYKYESQVEPVFSDISIKIYQNSRIGLIGKNGCGKTTLCRILANDLKNYKGNIWRNNDLLVGYIEQESSEELSILCGNYIFDVNPGMGTLWEQIHNPEPNEILPETVVNYIVMDGYLLEDSLARLLGQFELDEDILFRDYLSLSGGEKTKVRLLRCLLRGFDLMLLDEPTNHLDINTMEWLQDYLKNIRIPYVIISHDRFFLDKCVTSVWELNDGYLSEFTGDYSNYRQQKEAQLDFKKKQYSIAQGKIRQLTKAVHDKRNWAGSFQAQTGSEGRAFVYESITNAGKRSMQRAKVTEHRLERLRDKDESEKPFIEKKREISFSHPQKYGRFALVVDKIYKSFADKAILNDFSLNLNRGEKVAIIGDNGSGKSTLLKIITGQIPADKGEIRLIPTLKYGYFSQEFDDLDPEKTIIEEVSGGNRKYEEGSRTILGCLNIRGDKVFQKTDSLSFGEKNKTVLAKLIVAECDILLLDEPTNHLELEAREELEQALIDFPGAVLLVSHDRYLIKRVTHRSILISTKAIKPDNSIKNID